MKIQLQVGNYYKNKNQKIKKISLFQKHKKFPFSDTDGNTYKANGKHSWLNESDMDLYEPVKIIPFKQHP